jgi:eukaryotic-like serine/threonine-protein kinase
MNSASRPRTVRISHDALNDHVTAYQTALDLFGQAELAEFLPSRDHARYLEILCELVRADLSHGWQTGKPTALDTYQVRYPELFANAVMLFRLAQHEFLLRQLAGENPSMSEYCKRFDLNSDEWPTQRRKVPRARALDPDVSSKFDIALSGDAIESYPLTSRLTAGETPPSWSSAGNGQTRQLPPADKRLSQLSDPELDWKLKLTMTEMPKVGDEFLGFSLLVELGKGAFGKVFLAQQGQLARRLVALKVAAGLFSESQTLAQLQHTHIVPIYSYHHGQPFQAVCMPYLGSTTLAHVLADIRAHKSMPSSGKELLSTVNGRKKSTQRFEDSCNAAGPDPAHDHAPTDHAHTDAGESAPAAVKTPARALELEGMNYVDSILWLAVRLADGLGHAHAHGIVHRDLKPANILLTDDGMPMLLDFNLAQDHKRHDSAAQASIGGTLPYMAPEHLEAFRGHEMPVDARSDLYSVGVILFELLTGSAPFPSYRKLPMRETVNRMIQDRRDGAPRLRPLNPLIAPAFEAIVLRCLEADPARRYQTVADLREDLQCQLDQKPLKHAANPSLWERCQKFRRRHPRLASVTTVAAVFCVLIAGLTSAFAVREEQHRSLQARQTLVRFHDDAQTAYFLLNARTARDQLAEGELACRSTLAHFQVLENPGWRDAPAVRRLPTDDQQRLQTEVGQLLVLLAHAQQLAGERATDPARREAMFQEGLQLCSLATDCFGEERSPLALLKQQGELHQGLNERARALQFFERARQADLRTAQDRFLAARLLAEEGKFRAALPLVRAAIRLSPQDFNLHFLQGMCHDYLGQHVEAAACYRSCIALRPNFYGAYYNRGLSYLRQNDHQAARADFDEAARLNPAFVEIYVQRALAWQGLAKYPEGIADLTEALERGATQTRIYFLRARLREKAGDPAGAKKDVAEGMRRAPADAESWVARGIAHLPADPKRALDDFDQALQLDPRSLAALHNKAHVLGKYFRRTQDAVKTLDKAVLLYPDDVRPLAGRGLYLARLGKRDAAIKDAEQALALDASPANQYQVAGIYALTSRQAPNDKEEAMRLLSAALKKGVGFDYLDIDRDLDPIRTMPAFRRVVEAARALQNAAPKRF